MDDGPSKCYKLQAIKTRTEEKAIGYIAGSD
jgi:hypothetical protein